ncbi:MAG: hypothetical protein QM308_01305 [Bacillota bacterium]|nr:hypothetical protein [Bacillota bacterium]
MSNILRSNHLVSELSELLKNFQTLDGYLNLKVDPEYTYAINLIKRGICFVAVKDSNSYKFYPSKFSGYSGNSMYNHEKNLCYRNGRETNKAIERIMGSKPSNNPALEREYIKYCESLGFETREKGTFGVGRKFWLLEK